MGCFKLFFSLCKVNYIINHLNCKQLCNCEIRAYDCSVFCPYYQLDSNSPAYGISPIQDGFWLHLSRHITNDVLAHTSFTELLGPRYLLGHLLVSLFYFAKCIETSCREFNWQGIQRNIKYKSCSPCPTSGKKNIKSLPNQTKDPCIHMRASKVWNGFIKKAPSLPLLSSCLLSSPPPLLSLPFLSSPLPLPTLPFPFSPLPSLLFPSLPMQLGHKSADITYTGNIP